VPIEQDIEVEDLIGQLKTKYRELDEKSGKIRILISNLENVSPKPRRGTDQNTIVYEYDCQDRNTGDSMTDSERVSLRTKCITRANTILN
jgi:hypothetical protein